MRSISDGSADSAPSAVPQLSRAFSSFSFSRNWSVSIPEEDSWAPYGLNLLYSPPEPLIDLIFVHGLRGGSVKTWCKDSDPRLFWPKAWLPREPDLQNVRIHSFGYNADWKDTKETSLDMHDFGRSLFSDMTTSPYLRHDQETQIVLVGHSMGGLVIKKAVLLAYQDPQTQDLANRIQAMFFLATPHRGSDSAKLLNNILRASTVLSSRQYINELSRNSTSLQIISDEFRMIADRLQLWSFYETLKTKVSSSASLLVVDRESAVLGYKDERIQLLNADHKGVCKFDSPSDPNYRTVRNSLAKAVANILGDVVARKADESRAMIGRLELYLGIGHFAEDDLNSLRALQSDGSCNWIVDHSTFQGWRDSSKKLPSVYWLTGQPGSGKSVTSGHVIAHLQELGLNVCYYFFRHGHKEQQSASGFIRQLAYQMASQNPAIRQRLCDMQNRGVTLDRDDERALWRRLFVNEILDIQLPNQQFWVIDGVDECSDSAKLLALLFKINSAYPINLFLSSRKVQGLERLFSPLRDRLRNHSIAQNDTREDIRCYIETQCDSLVVDAKYRHELVETMLKKSDGSFLWTKLAFEELEHVYSEDTMSEVLEGIPDGMSALYDRVLATMSKNSREINLTHAILSWAVCAMRNLSANELQAALQLDINSNIPNVERTVEGLCGQLVRIEKNSMVQVTHATVRDFLMEGCPQSPFAIKRSETHERLAEVCLHYLSSDELKPPKTQTLMSELKTVRSPFADYAATSWSDHLMSASSQSHSLLKIVSRFLETNVLSWIELTLRRKRDLSPISRAAKNLRNYLDRRAKYLSPVEYDFLNVSQWATDLLRIVAKFGRNLLVQPLAIYFVIPPLCPIRSGIHKQFGTGRGFLSLEGFSNISWGDCISSIEHRDTRPRSLAGGENVFAIGLNSGYVKVYHTLTCQEKVSLHHGEIVKITNLDHTSQKIVTSGKKSLKMWNADGHMIWETTHATPVASIQFSQDDQLIVACTKRGDILCWRTIDGLELTINPSLEDNPRQPARDTSQIILSSSISPDLRTVALACFNRPPQIWSLEKDVWIGSCEKQELSAFNVFYNPNPSIEVLAVMYQSGELAVFDTWSQEELASASADAHMIAAAPDGRTLATGDTLGTVKLWDFETLHLLYCIKSPDDGIMSMAFSSDGLRLIDIRELKCKIWEPTALVRKTLTDASSISESASVNEVAITVGSYGKTVTITDLVLSEEDGCIFMGKNDGSVHAFDIATATSSHLYDHHLRVFSISWSAGTQQLATVDSSSRLQIWLLRKYSTSSWRTAFKTTDLELSSYGREIALSPDASHILMSGYKPEMLRVSEFPRPGTCLVDVTHAVWRASSFADTLVIAITDAGMLLVTDYGSPTTAVASVKLLGPNSSAFTGIVTKLALDKTGKYVLVELEDCRHDETAPKCVVYETEKLLHTSVKDNSTLMPLLCLQGSEVRSVLGFYGTKLVYLDRRLWVHSQALDTPEAGETRRLASGAIRHFFIPFELVGGNNGVDGVVTREGDVVFPKEGELVIVRNALTWSI